MALTKPSTPSKPSRVHPAALVSAALALFMVVILALGSTALAATKAYEFTGKWIDQPEYAVSHHDVLGTIWHFDINDDAHAPGNASVADNILTLTAENGYFTEIPSTCTGPLTELSEDRRNLTCDLGERFEGTAEFAFAGVYVDGPPNSEVGVNGTFRGLKVELPKIPIRAPFSMDAKFNDGGPASVQRINSTDQLITFPFSISHAKQTAAGPDSVSYDLTMTYNGNAAAPQVALEGQGCVPNTTRQSGFPLSGDAVTTNSTYFPQCEIVSTGTNQYRLTLSGLQYGAGPELDSNGQPLPLDSDVIAAGNLTFKVTYRNPGGQVSISASAPTYESVDGQTAQDNRDNNSNRVPVVRGSWTGGWTVASQSPVSYPGTPWTDTSKAPAGATVMSASGVRVPFNPNQRGDNWLCQILDTDHVVFERARVSYDQSASPSLYYHDSGKEIWYYTGEVADPNTFECGTTTKRGDDAFGNPEGWSNTPPADLSTVKAVKTVVKPAFAAEVNNYNNMVFLMVDQRIKPDTPIGTDIWTFNTALKEGNTSWAWNDPFRREADRTLVATDVKPFGTATPGLQYPYAGPHRDVLRVVGSSPLVSKDVAKAEYGPGEQAEYTVSFGLESNLANPAPDAVTVIDQLPQGMRYVEDSASVEPVRVDTNQIIWRFEDVMPNAEQQTITYKVEVLGSVAPGSRLTNVASAVSQDQVRSASAQIIVPNSGFTRIIKSVEVCDAPSTPEGETAGPGTVAEVSTIGETSEDPCAAPSAEPTTEVSAVASDEPQTTEDAEPTTEPTAEPTTEPTSESTAAKPVWETEDGTALAVWSIQLISVDPSTQKFTDTIDILPFVEKDDRGNTFTGTHSVTKVEVPAGATVYSTNLDPSTLDEDPGAVANGKPGEPSDIWQKGMVENATAIRIIAPGLTYGQDSVVKIHAQLAGATPQTDYVNSAVARTDTTKMRMRTSAGFGIGSAGEVIPPTEPPTTPPSTPPTTPEEPTTPPATPPASTTPEEPVPPIPTIPVPVPVPSPSEPRPSESVNTPNETTPQTEQPRSVRQLSNTGANVLLLALLAACLLAAGVWVRFRSTPSN
ncbi:DUF11 domain-containing protein [Corynebacterium kozikiae]|uniref:DUF11 domain-containing protein n=1 Tax=Corynebacterium kozikiae TaxID=2968469 RepID=UPI00211B808D|nr:DUF11 domain-containing protein [Corynebacterium sp. 76QC2CO]MCQ9342760.1 DUF11 domain-containing protein [Corynebacterium sp. 76QC2CO]